MALEDLSHMQRYLGEEMIDQAREGVISRRDMMVRLVAICGSAATASALLAACGDDNAGPAVTGTQGSTTTTAPGATTTTSTPPTTAAGATASTVVTPPTTAGSGAVLSVAATDAAVKAQDVSFPGPAATMLGYEAAPATGGRTAGIIVIHENRGLTDHIRDVTRRLAKAGYHALAVDLASRSGGTAKVDANAIAGALSALKPDQIAADLDAGAAYLKARSDATGKIGIVGFCFGGGITLQYAAAAKSLNAAVPYYGPNPDPVSQMANTNAAILGHYGATDTRVNAGIDALESTLRNAGKVYEKRIWDGAGHAFNNDTGSAYNQTAAVSAWGVTLGWFAKYLAP